MTDDPTRTWPLEAPAAPAAVAPGLVVAWHADPAWMGCRAPLAAGEHLLGRDEEGPVPGLFRHPSTSRRHARLEVGGAGVLLADLGSANGTTVNGRRVERQVLREGDLVGLGPALLVFRSVCRARPRLPDTGLVGASDGLAAVVEAVAQCAPRASTALVLGETGTGKELVARALHGLSGRKGTFIPVNCGALSEGTLYAELYGHARGAYTGAQAPRRGLVLEAEGGTLFLDEIGDAPPALQVALLRFLESGEIRPLGEGRTRRVDVRVVAATHRPLGEGPAPAGFRQDLLERLRRWVIRVPPLRDRREDVPMLAEHLASRHGGPARRVSRALAEALALAAWPGNVRQLDAVMERLAAASPQGEISLPGWLSETLAAPPDPGPSTDRRPRERPSPEALLAGLREAGGNVVELSRRLGISRRTVYRWLEDAGLSVDAGRDGG